MSRTKGMEDERASVSSELEGKGADFPFLHENFAQLLWVSAASPGCQPKVLPCPADSRLQISSRKSESFATDVQLRGGKRQDLGDFDTWVAMISP